MKHLHILLVCRRLPEAVQRRNVRFACVGQRGIMCFVDV